MGPILPLWLGVIVVGAGCSGQAGGAARDTAATARPESVAVITPVDTTPDRDSIIQVVPDTVRGTLAPPPRDTTVVLSPSGSPIHTATVEEILASSALVGKTVRVTGTCLGYGGPRVAYGNPPRTRSDWQLVSRGLGVYVTGPTPAGCSATAGSTETSIIVATVVEDTLPALGANPARPRRYLEWKGPDRMPVRQQ